MYIIFWSVVLIIYICHSWSDRIKSYSWSDQVYPECTSANHIPSSLNNIDVACNCIRTIKGCYYSNLCSYILNPPNSLGYSFLTSKPVNLPQEKIINSIFHYQLQNLLRNPKYLSPASKSFANRLLRIANNCI